MWMKRLHNSLEILCEGGFETPEPSSLTLIVGVPARDEVCDSVALLALGCVMSAHVSSRESVTGGAALLALSALRER